ncbi:hypothetical protein NKR19_g8853 [Coniochaeta hoffmannii]|uniref:Mid2 domain-containing protein n=1 Tax=Coniochaeta hoffmannii TaxID=91930 RepID=A0AA38R579_9PEZI|nr:hypothetical protein NKR19_g8853 [Coniochaeta hoffmannii]
MKRDIFLRLPQPMAMLLLSAVLDLTSAHTLYPLPRQTGSSPQPTPTTVAHHVIDVVPFPTSPPKLTADLRRRQDPNTICGFIGGDPNLPATCSVGSHCVLDTQHGAIGCCPDNEPTCTTGIFTGCVDGNSPPQTEVNPYVFTCQGGDVCYQNVFEGGFHQFGCGTASDLATSVFATATGITETVDRSSLTFSFTETADTLTAPTTLATVTVPSSTEAPTETETPTSAVTPVSSKSPTTTETTSQTSPSASSSTEASSSASGTSSESSSTQSLGLTTSTTSESSSSTTSASTTSSSSSSSSISSSSASTSQTSTSSETSTLTSPTSNLITASATSEPTGAGAKSRDHTGAIVGGTISGLAVLIAAIALGIYLWQRKKRGPSDEGPGSHATGGPTAYVSPMSGAPFHSGGYAPAHQDQEGWETGMPPGAAAAAGGTGLGAGSALYPGHPYPPARTGYGYPSSQYPAGYGVGAGSSAAGAAGIYGGIPPPRPGREPYEPEAGDQIPLTREIDDFSRGFHDALGRIGEEDEYDSSPNHSGTGVNEGNGVNRPGGAGRGNESDDAVAGPYGGVRPLWQQQRRQSRNLMWM